MMEQLGFDAPEIVCRSCRRSDGHAHSCGLPRAEREALEEQRRMAASLAAEAEEWRAARHERPSPPMREPEQPVARPPAPALSEGQLRGLAGMARATAAEPLPWIQRADEAIARLAREGVEFTSEDVRRIAGDPEHPNAMGGRFNAAARRRLILCVGRRPAERPSLHGHELRVWRGR